MWSKRRIDSLKTIKVVKGGKKGEITVKKKKEEGAQS